MDNLSLELQTAIDAAKAGAEVAIKYYKGEKDLRVQFKADTSILTIADSASEKAIKGAILSLFPNAKFIAEEESASVPAGDEFWIIDPIDGTTEFSKGIDMWGIMIAYAKNDEVLVGVCYFPILNVLLTSEKGKGAFSNGKQLFCSKTPELAKALMGISSVKYYKDYERQKMIESTNYIWSARCLFSSISCYYVASGKYDFFIASSHNNIWDVAPFILIIEEAGGKVTDWKGDKLSTTNMSSNMVVSNGILHEQIIKMLNS